MFGLGKGSVKGEFISLHCYTFPIANIIFNHNKRTLSNMIFLTDCSLIHYIIWGNKEQPSFNLWMVTIYFFFLLCVYEYDDCWVGGPQLYEFMNLVKFSNISLCCIHEYSGTWLASSVFML